MPDDDRRFVNNSFARALHPKPDDDKATSPVMYVAVGVMSLVLVCVFVAALVLPPLLIETMLVRGLRSERWGMFAMGVIGALFYFAMIVAAGRRIMGRQKATETEEAGHGHGRGHGHGDGER